MSSQSGFFVCLAAVIYSFLLNQVPGRNFLQAASIQLFDVGDFVWTFPISHGGAGGGRTLRI